MLKKINLNAVLAYASELAAFAAFRQHRTMKWKQVPTTATAIAWELVRLYSYYVETSTDPTMNRTQQQGNEKPCTAMHAMKYHDDNSVQELARAML